MARGALAKDVVAKKIAAAFGADFVGEYDKKLYVWAEENGEKVQIAISMTCPKVPVGASDFSAEPGNSLNFEDMSAAVVAPKSFEPAEVTDEEKKNIAEFDVYKNFFYNKYVIKIKKEKNKDSNSQTNTIIRQKSR